MKRVPPPVRRWTPSLRPFHRGSALIAAIGALLCTGCPTDPGNGNDNTGDTLSAVIKNVTAVIQVSGDQELTIRYDALPEEADVAAFYLPVASTDPDAPATGNQVVFDNTLTGGIDQTTTLMTGSMPLGVYKVGLDLTYQGQTLTVFASGAIEVTTLPTPVFQLPNATTNVEPGTVVPVRVAVGDPENAVHWRLFYLPVDAATDAPADELGEEIATGTANVADVNWRTPNNQLGEFRIGVFVTDSGQSIEDTVDAGETDRILGPVFCDFNVTLSEEPPTPVPPSVTVNQPASNQSVIVTNPANPQDGFVQVQFTANVFVESNAQKIDVFYDFDRVANSGDEVIFSANNPISTSNAVFSAALIDIGETVNIGVTVNDGVTDPVTRYASGRVTRLDPDAALLTVTQPNSTLPRQPGETVSIAWNVTNLPADVTGETYVYIRRLDASGNPIDTIADSDPINTSGLPVSGSTTHVMDSSGRFVVTVRVEFESAAIDDLEKDAPKIVVVSTRPAIFWVGSLDPGPDNSFARVVDGAIFEGVNFEDNAGSSFAGGADFDGDGADECIIVSRYGKPEFVNPSGVGAGEAYFLRGSAERYIGKFNLNSVGSPTIPGVVFTGLEPDLPDNPAASLYETDGMANVLITNAGEDEFGPIDSDADGVGEIVFGFPRTRSQKIGALGGINKVEVDDTGNPVEPCFPDQVTASRDHEGWSIPHFFRGGVVIVSSVNAVLSTTGGDLLGRRVFLDRVGQVFRSTLSGLDPWAQTGVNPAEQSNAIVCSAAGNWFEDFLAWDEDDECPTGEADTGGEVGCFSNIGGDGDLDTLVGPTYGFDPRLADPWPCLRTPTSTTKFIYGLLAEEECLGIPGMCPSCDTRCADPADCTDNQFADGPLFGAPTRELFAEGTDDEPATPPDCLADLPDYSCDAQKLAAAQDLPVGEPVMSRFYRSGLYVEQFENPDGNGRTWNDIREASLDSFGHVGARIIGELNYNAAGTTFTASGRDLIIAAPFASIQNRGEAYIIPFDPSPTSAIGLPRYWQLPYSPGRGLVWTPGDYGENRVPIRPHQYLVSGNSGTCCSIQSNFAYDNFYDTNFQYDNRIFGDVDELIQTLVAVPDFNEDSRNDVAIGAPLADVDSNGTPDGAVYIIFRRDRNLEGNFLLNLLKRDTTDPNRLAGLLVREAWDEGQRFGASIAGGFDFNHDGVSDVAIGNPDGNDGTGEVVIVFGDRDTISQREGIPVESEGGNLGLLDRRQGFRITGVETGSEFGIYIANVGDLDGDGLDELAIAAPNATPMFDSDPNDADDSLDTPGLDGVVDLDGNGEADAPDGVADDVTGPLGRPDGLVNANDELRHAGLVYVILSSTVAASLADGPAAPMDASINQLGDGTLDGFIIVGRRGDRFAADDPNGDNDPIHPGDFMGGGMAGATTREIPFASITIDYGGNPAKEPQDVFDAEGNPKVTSSGEPLLRERGQAFSLGRAGDVDGDGREDLLIGAQLADPRVDPITGEGTRNAGEAYLIYGFGQ